MKINFKHSATVEHYLSNEMAPSERASGPSWSAVVSPVLGCIGSAGPAPTKKAADMAVAMAILIDLSLRSLGSRSVIRNLVDAGTEVRLQGYWP